MDIENSVKAEGERSESQASGLPGCLQARQVADRWKGWSRSVKGAKDVGELRAAQLNRGTAWIRFACVCGALLAALIGVSYFLEVNVVVNRPVINVENGVVNYSGDAYSVEVGMGNK